MVLGIQEYSIFVAMIPAENKKNRQIALLIIVAALGYFVDIYDLVLFGVVKAESLDQIMTKASPDAKAAMGKFLFNMQMLGMLIGGLLWGILGDNATRAYMLKHMYGIVEKKYEDTPSIWERMSDRDLAIMQEKNK